MGISNEPFNYWKNSSTLRSLMQKEIKQRRNQVQGLFFNILQIKMKKKQRRHLSPNQRDQEIQPIEQAEEKEPYTQMQNQKIKDILDEGKGESRNGNIKVERSVQSSNNNTFWSKKAKKFVFVPPHRMAERNLDFSAAFIRQKALTPGRVRYQKKNREIITQKSRRNSTDTEVVHPIEIRLREGSNKTVISTFLNSNLSSKNLGITSTRKILSPNSPPNINGMNILRPQFQISLNPEPKTENSLVTKKMSLVEDIQKYKPPSPVIRSGGPHTPTESLQIRGRVSILSKNASGRRIGAGGTSVTPMIPKMQESLMIQTESFGDQNMSNDGQLCERFVKQHQNLAKYEKKVLQGQTQRAKKMAEKIMQRDFLRRYSKESSRNPTPKNQTSRNVQTQDSNKTCTDIWKLENVLIQENRLNEHSSIQEHYDSNMTGLEESSRGDLEDQIKFPMFRGNIRVLQQNRKKLKTSGDAVPPFKRRVVSPFRKKEDLIQKVNQLNRRVLQIPKVQDLAIAFENLKVESLTPKPDLMKVKPSPKSKDYYFHLPFKLSNL